MKLNKFNSKPIKPGRWWIASLVFFTLAFFLAAGGWCDNVAPATAQRVAEQQLRLHVDLYGHWNHSAAPTIADVQEVRRAARVVAYNFSIDPSGHILVAVDDAFSPVLLYSATSSFDPDRADDPNAIESWIVPELDHRVGRLETRRRATASSDGLQRGAAGAASDQRIRDAWAYYTQQTTLNEVADGRRGATVKSIADPAAVGPLLESAWGQNFPYNSQTLVDGACQTVTGCVATAWAQLMHYWKWPRKATGSVAYEWPYLSPTRTLSIDFDQEALAYDWDSMPAKLFANSSVAEIESVSNLIYHVGLAAEMDFGCDASYSILFADQVLPKHFHYKKNRTVHYDRLEHSYEDGQWLNLFRSELDGDPPRPVVLTIFSDVGGHEVVADGYQSSLTDLIHVNFGLRGNYDGFYNITESFATNDVEWEANTQIMVAGIEPDNDPPIITPIADKSVVEGSTVELKASATDPEQMGDIAYQWKQTAGVTVALTGADIATARFTAPQIDKDTTLQFELRATDVNRAFAVEQVTVTVADKPTPPSSGGGGGGGCFIMTLWP
jgi:hypothetical protein